jgi:DNA-binding NarL/FixJ family response regulator
MGNAGPPRVLAVDDTPANIEVFESLLAPRGYVVEGATSGPAALEAIAQTQPDLVLLDVVMPGMDGIEVCRQIRADPETTMLPVIMVTAGTNEQRIRALEVGADDFLTKPIDRTELLARVRSLVRIKRFQDTIQAQSGELRVWNRTLELRVQAQVDELERLQRLRAFLSPRLADLLICAEGETLLESHRRQLAVVCCRMPGFWAVADRLAPDTALSMLNEYQAAVGTVGFEHEASLGPLGMDCVTLYMNDPLPVDSPAAQAIQLAQALHARSTELSVSWSERGLESGFGIGVDIGEAILGSVAHAGRTDYMAIGAVVRMAAGLTEYARPGQTLLTQRVAAAVGSQFPVASVGGVVLPGVHAPVQAFELAPNEGGRVAPPAAPAPAEPSGPLTEREREVVALIARGCSNREIAQLLTIAEGTAVRHVANILGKLGFRSRAQVAVWAVQHPSSVASSG